VATLTVKVGVPEMYPPLMWQSPGPASAVSSMVMCMGMGTSTFPLAREANAFSTEVMASPTVRLATTVS